MEKDYEEVAVEAADDAEGDEDGAAAENGGNAPAGDEF
jgi:hypothetical protein